MQSTGTDLKGVIFLSTSPRRVNAENTSRKAMFRLQVTLGDFLFKGGVKYGTA